MRHLATMLSALAIFCGAARARADEPAQAAVASARCSTAARGTAVIPEAPRSPSASAVTSVPVNPYYHGADERRLPVVPDRSVPSIAVPAAYAERVVANPYYHHE